MLLFSDGTSGEIHSAISQDILLTTSAYDIDTSATSQYFAPSLLFVLMVYFRLWKIGQKCRKWRHLM